MSGITVGLGLDTSSLNDSRSLISASASSLRSASSMKGLLQAESGEAMVELDAGNGTSGFKEGSRIIPGSMTPLNSASQVMGHEWSPEKASLSRHGTLLTANATPSRNAAELRSILGNSNARLKPGASIIPVGALSSTESTSLEQAKPRARVEVDIIPDTNVYVQGGYINGIVRLRIRPRSRTESGVLISDGKIRVVGFECIQNDEKRHTFYQQSAPLSDVSPSAGFLFDSPPDNEGFYMAKEGVHVLPFSMFLVLEGGEGMPKGTISPHVGIAVRYILMVSVKIREIETDKRSIAHFYRDCEIWPRLNPSAVLAPAAQPIRETAAKSFFMGGSGKVGLTASLHRLSWIAGQPCCVKVRVINKSKKTLKSITLNLIRSTVTYKPNPSLGFDESEEHDADACQTSTVQKQVAESVLEMGQRDHTRGHASAKGWWTGVRPDETREFYHFLSIPSDAITIPRARLLEVSYIIRVTVSAGPLTSNVQVLLPIRIISFLSVDPPPSFPTEDKALLDFLGQKPPPEIDDIPEEDPYAPRTLNGRVLEPLSEDDTTDVEYDGDANPETDNESLLGHSFSSRSSILDSNQPSEHDPQPRQLGNAAACDDNDDFVQQAITTLKIDAKYAECGGRFADLYYTSKPEDLPEINRDEKPFESELVETATPGRRPPEKESCQVCPRSSVSNITDGVSSRPTRPRGPSSFAERVQQKLQAKEDTRQAGSQPVTCTSPESKAISPMFARHHSKQFTPSRQPSAQGDTGMSRKRSSTVGSYFRPRHEIPDEVEVLGEEHPSNDDIPPRSPFAEISRRASELSSLTFEESKTGSRQLTTGLPPQPGGSAIMQGALSPRSDSVSHTIELKETAPPSSQLQHDEGINGISTSQPKIGTIRRRSHTLAVTPSKAALPKENPISTVGNSVKDRIRMLEEKARTEKDSGPL